jgi:hypothetical protein
MAPDVTVLGMGSDDVWNPHVANGSTVHVTEAPRLARTLARHRRQRPEASIYWRTLPVTCASRAPPPPSPPPASTNGLWPMSAASPPSTGVAPARAPVLGSDALNRVLIGVSNGILAALCHAPTAVVPGLRVLDEWSWTYGQCAEYDDSVHHAKLAVAHVHALLRDVCGGGGDGE